MAVFEGNGSKKIPLPALVTVYLENPKFRVHGNVPYRPLQGRWAWTPRQKKRGVHADVPLTCVEAMSAWTPNFGFYREDPGAGKREEAGDGKVEKGRPGCRG